MCSPWNRVECMVYYFSSWANKIFPYALQTYQNGNPLLKVIGRVDAYKSHILHFLIDLVTMIASC